MCACVDIVGCVFCGLDIVGYVFCGLDIVGCVFQDQVTNIITSVYSRGVDCMLLLCRVDVRSVVCVSGSSNLQNYWWQLFSLHDKSH